MLRNNHSTFYLFHRQDKLLHKSLFKGCFKILIYQILTINQKLIVKFWSILLIMIYAKVYLVDSRSCLSLLKSRSCVSSFTFVNKSRNFQRLPLSLLSLMGIASNWKITIAILNPQRSDDRKLLTISSIFGSVHWFWEFFYVYISTLRSNC